MSDGGRRDSALEALSRRCGSLGFGVGVRDLERRGDTGAEVSGEGTTCVLSISWVGDTSSLVCDLLLACSERPVRVKPQECGGGAHQLADTHRHGLGPPSVLCLCVPVRATRRFRLCVWDDRSFIVPETQRHDALDSRGFALLDGCENDAVASTVSMRGRSHLHLMQTHRDVLRLRRHSCPLTLYLYPKLLGAPARLRAELRSAEHASRLLRQG